MKRSSRASGKAIILAILLVACSVFLFACIGKPETPKPGPQEETNPFYHPGLGFSKGTASKESVYRDLLGGLGGPLDALNSTQTRFISSDLEMSVRLNDVEMSLNYYLRYDQNATDEQASMISLTKKADNRNLATAYFYAGKKTLPDASEAIDDVIYLQIGEQTKMAIPLDHETFLRFSPSGLKYDLAWYANIFDDIFITKSDPLFEYKLEQGRYTRHFQIELDVPKTLEAMIDYARTQNFLEEETVAFILDAMLDVTIADVRTGNLPEMSMIVDFYTANSSKMDDFGNCALSNVQVLVDVPNPQEDRSALLMREHTELEISRFVVRSSTQTPIPDESQFVGWQDYRQGAYRLSADVKRNGEDLDFRCDLKFGSSYDTMQMVAYVQNAARQREVEISYLNGVLQVYMRVDSMRTVQFELEVDLYGVMGKLLQRFRQIGQADLLQVLSFVLGNVQTLSEGEVRVALSNDFFHELLHLDSYEFISILDKYNLGDVGAEEVLRQGGWEENLDYTFDLILDLNAEFISRISAVSMPTRP